MTDTNKDYSSELDEILASLEYAVDYLKSDYAVSQRDEDEYQADHDKQLAEAKAKLSALLRRVERGADLSKHSEPKEPVATKPITQANFWKFDRRVRSVLKSYGYTPINDLMGSIHAAARQFYADDAVTDLASERPADPEDISNPPSRELEAEL